MKQEESMKYAYAAGFIDGEGCIRINRRNARNGRSVNHSLLVTAVQKDGRPIDWLVGVFGGTVYFKRKDKEGLDWVYEWRITDKSAYEVLKKIYPFLRVKKAQAEIGIRFQERRIHSQKHEKGKAHFQPLASHEIEEREKMYAEMCALKRAWVKAKYQNVKDYHCPSMVQA